MTYQRREYVLADKLKSEFKERGKDVSGIRASSTSELMRRAAMNGDPHENCAENAFRESYNKRASNNAYANQRNRPGRTMNDASGSVPRKKNTNYSNRYDRQSTSGGAAMASRMNQTASGKSLNGKPFNVKRQLGVKPLNEKLRNEVKDTTRKKLPFGFVAFLGVAVVMVMFLITQISNVYETANDVAQLENKLSQMQVEANELKLQLDEKNDIREIEQIATTKLGMAKEDTMQRRYVTLSDGERIEVIDNAETEENSGGIMLSSIVSAIEKLFD